MDLGLVETEIGESSALDPAVLGGDGTLFVVDQEEDERRAGVMRKDRVREHASVGHVIARDDRADVQHWAQNHS